jgi:hypothetical protein
MSLEKWVEYDWLRAEPSSPDEIRNLFSIVERSIKDAHVEASPLSHLSCAPFLKERRMKFREPTKLLRKWGVGHPAMVAGIEP